MMIDLTSDNTSLYENLSEFLFVPLVGYNSDGILTILFNSVALSVKFGP